MIFHFDLKTIGCNLECVQNLEKGDEILFGLVQTCRDMLSKEEPRNSSYHNMSGHVGYEANHWRKFYESKSWDGAFSNGKMGNRNDNSTYE